MHKLSSGTYMSDDFPFWITRMTQRSFYEHGHDFIELVYVVRGSGIHIFEGTKYTLQSGDVFIVNPGETHSYSVENGEYSEIINCLFMPSFIPDTLLHELEITGAMDYFYVHPFLSEEIRFNRRLNLSGEAADSVLALLESMIREIGKGGMGYKTLIRLQMIELLVLLSRYYKEMHQQRIDTEPRKQDRLLTARRLYGYMERNYAKKIAMQSLAVLFGVSTRQINRLMAQEFGKSAIDVLHDIRIARAKHLLQETDEKVTAIAMSVGYDDPSFFSRLFQRHVGCTPTQFRSGATRSVAHSKEEMSG
jgi:AraC-like DNA-binding protein